ncbi:MAG: chemotaxis protein CheW [Gammaproteobacteria bacterium]|nr:chemotaxis protein CheW [Gammaproteobacteria bacterium]
MNVVKASDQMLFLSTKSYRFCIPVVEVDRLMQLMEVQEVPQAPNYLVGIMNLYGEAVPVLDLALRMGVANDDKYTAQTPVILVSCKKKNCVLIVDNIERVDQVSSGQIRAEKLFSEGQHLVKATVVTGSETALLLDTWRVIDIDMDASGISLNLSEELLSLCKIKTESA